MRRIKVFCGTLLIISILGKAQTTNSDANYKKLEGKIFVRDPSYDNKIGSESNAIGATSLIRCSTLCGVDNCEGFFFNNITKQCLLMNHDVSESRLSAVHNFSFFRKQVADKSTATTQLDTQFEQDFYSNNMVPINPYETRSIELIDCVSLCAKDPYVGFFYNTAYTKCFPVTKAFISGLRTQQSMIYYKRKVRKQSRTITLEYNTCPPLRKGTLIINMTSEERYEIYIQPSLSTHDQASSVCTSKGKKLLEMKGQLKYEYVKYLLDCEDFKGKEFWVGAQFDGRQWKFHDQRPVIKSYFCRGKPNAQELERCARFQGGCLNDKVCGEKASVMCD